MSRECGFDIVNRRKSRKCHDSQQSIGVQFGDLLARESPLRCQALETLLGVVLFVVGPPLDRVRHKSSDAFQLIFGDLEGSQPPVQLRRRHMSFVMFDEP